MNTVFKVFLSMSFSGSLLILLLLAGKRIFKNKLSRQWQYYIWLIIILRMLIPFGAEQNLLGKAYQSADSVMTQSFSAEKNEFSAKLSTDTTDTIGTEASDQNVGQPFRDIILLPVNQIWIIWIAAAAGIMIRKITAYRSFSRYVRIGSIPVDDIALLERLSVIAAENGIKQPIELCVNTLVPSPMLIGFFRPCIVLKNIDISEKDFLYTVTHELMHFKRRDILYKWLVQIAVCLHWFNPLVYVMSSEISKTCEFSCDEAVISRIGRENAAEYGKTLLDAAGRAGKSDVYPESVGLSKNNRILKERLGAIMNFEKKKKTVSVFTCALTVITAAAAFFIGTYPVEAKAMYHTYRGEAANGGSGTFAEDAEKYYKNGSLPLFEIAFSRMDKNEQKAWIERIYKDSEIGFFGAVADSLSGDSRLINAFAEKFYKDEAIAFFSVLADMMSDNELEAWLERALEDKSFIFQSMLFDKLDMEEEKDLLEEELAKKQIEEYEAVGVTKNGKEYYYRGQPIGVFLDIRPDKSFYTLEIAPKGKVNVKIIRGEDGKIKNTEIMSDSEAEKFLEEFLSEEEDWENCGEITVPIEFDIIKGGEYAWLGTYDLEENDRVSYHVTAEDGRAITVGFARSAAGRPNTTYNTISNIKQDGVLKIETDDFKWVLSPGEYSLFIYAKGGNLSGVKGYVTIIKSDS